MESGAKLLVLGAGHQRERAFHQWAADGLRVTLVDGFSYARYEHLVEHSVAWDVRDGAAPDLAALAALAAGHQGVTTLSDDCQITAALLAERLGLPSAGVDAARLARDKGRQRTVAAQHGLPAVAHLVTEDPQSVAAFVEERQGPCVVKPVGAGGSASVARAAGAKEALAACERIRLRGDRLFLVEEFLTGPEISYEGVVRAGRVELASVTEKEVVSDSCFLERQHLVTAPGAPGQPPEPDGVQALARGLVLAYGVQDAIIHLEVKLTDRGPVPVEIAVRPAGDCVPEVIERALGRSLYRQLAALATGGEAPGDLPPQDGTVAAGVRFSLGRGRVTGYARPVDVLQGLSTVRTAVQSAQTGREYGEPTGNWDRAGYVLGWGADRALLERELAVASDRQLTLAGLSWQ